MPSPTQSPPIELLAKLVKQRGNAALLQTLPPFQPGISYSGLPIGGNAQLIEITPASDPAFAFVEVYVWADGAKTAQSAFSRRAILLEAVPAFLAMGEELRFVESIEWLIQDSKLGSPEHPHWKGYHRSIDEGWIHRIDQRRKKALRAAQ